MPYNGMIDIQLQFRSEHGEETAISIGGDQMAALLNKGHLLWTPIKIDRKQLLNAEQRQCLKFRDPLPEEESREDEEGNQGRWYADWAPAQVLASLFDTVLRHLVTEHKLLDGASTALEETIREYAAEADPHPVQYASALHRAATCYDAPYAHLVKAHELAQLAALCRCQARLIYDYI